MPMKSAHMAMELAIEKAKKSGIAYVGVNHSSHFGAAGYYAVIAAKNDLIGLSMCNTDPCMTVPGGRGMIIGTNPLAYAVPAGKERPIFLDIATSTVAAGKVHAAKAMGKKIPDNWLVDDDGLPTDELIFPEHGALTPMAGHKGYGIALLIEIFSAALTGAAILSGVKSWALDLSEASNAGHAFIAIDVGAIMPLQEFKDRIDAMIREIKGSPKAKGTDRIYLPGEREWENRDEALKNGMKLPENVLDSLLGLAQDVGLKLSDFWE
jgi:LDH2 family malate/lactate/ureidoglycolate dehydrogenase